MTQCIQVITTVAVQEDADKLARLVLEKRLAACIQITQCSSLYHWQGAIEQDNELKLIMKSSVNLYPQLEKFILDHHPYDTPEILATPVQFVNSGYLNWLAGELKAE